jgi:hypothetical protein
LRTNTLGLKVINDFVAVELVARCEESFAARLLVVVDQVSVRHKHEALIKVLLPRVTHM